MTNASEGAKVELGDVSASPSERGAGPATALGGVPAPQLPQRPNTVAGLLEKHREIAGLIEAKRAEIARLVADLEAIEHTIRLFDPQAQLPRAKPLPSPHAAFKGEMRRDVLACLRAAQGPLTSLEIAEQVIAVRKLDPALTTMFRKRVGAALWKLKGRGIAEEVPCEGDYKRWKLRPS